MEHLSFQVVFISVDYMYPKTMTQAGFCVDKDNYVLDANANNR